MAWTNSTNWVTTASTGTYVMPLTFTAPPRPSPAAAETPLQWLDREVEKTCAIARAAS